MDPEIIALESKVVELQGRLRELRARKLKPLSGAFTFTSPSGPVRLEELFGDAHRLIVIHNMGAACRYCGAYADGFSGILPHILPHAAFVLASPDPVDVLVETAQRRGWTFRVVSMAGTTFNKDMGFQGEDGSPWPGVSAFEKAEDGTVQRVGFSSFEPGDAFSPLWPLLQLFDPKADSWAPSAR